MSITMIGLDTAKSVFQVHAVDGARQVVVRRKLHREELLAFFEKQGACTVAMEACGAARPVPLDRVPHRARGGRHRQAASAHR